MTEQPERAVTNASDPPSGNSTRWRVPVAALAGLLVGGGIGWLVFSPDDSTDLSIMCDRLETLPEDEVFTGEEPQISLEDPEFWRLQGLSLLAVAAGYEDNDEDLQEAGKDVVSAVTRLDLAAVAEPLGTLEEYCG